MEKVLTLRAVEYLRVSTEEQAKGYGIAYTGKKTRKYIEKKNWAHVDTYADEGFSGSLEAHERDDLRRLMEAARTSPRPFDVVVVHEERAIGRAGRAFWPWVWELEDLGVFVAIAKEDYDNTTPAGRSKMRKAADYAEDEREKIRDRTQGGAQEKAEDGGYVGGKVPYGYRVENQGKRGESRLVIDETDAHTLRRGRALFIEHCNWRKAAILINAEGLHTRSGKPWTDTNLKERVTSETLLNAQQIFRNPKHRNTALDADGKPVYGETVTIQLDPIFSPEEVSELRQAMAQRPIKTKGSGGRVYTLSTRLVSPCGAAYTGFGRTGKEGRHYRCQGKNERFAGAKVCACPRIDADAVERYVWGKLRDFLGDEQRVKKLAEGWVGTVADRRTDFAARVAELGSQAEELESVISVTTAVSAREAIRRGLSQEEAEQAVSRAIAPLNDELAQVQELRAQAAAWQAEAEGANQRARTLQELAAVAHGRLGTLTPVQQAEFLALLNIKATVAGDVPRARPGSPCSLTKWFQEHGRRVPDLTDSAWAKVAPLMKVQHRKLDPRQMLAGIFHKARTGVRWPELPAEYGAHSSVKTYWRRWEQSGLWAQIMEALAEEPGAKAYAEDVTPPVTLTGELLPELLLEPQAHSATPAPSVKFSRVPFRFQIDLAA